LIKHILKRGTISIDYVKEGQNLIDPLMTPLEKNMNLETSREMRLRPLTNK